MKKQLNTNKIKFILILCLSILSVSADNSKNIFFSPALSTSLRIPIETAADHWKRYNSAGMHFEFPSKVKNLQCNVGLEAAKIYHENNITSVYLLHVHFGVQYVLPTRFSWLKFLPQLSLTNTMASDVNSFDALVKNNRISFAVVENEYGLRAGIEPRFVFGNFYFGIPLIIERTFSSPDRFDLFLITVNCGYTIRL